MARPRKLTQEAAYLAYYIMNEAPGNRGSRDAAEEVKKVYGIIIHFTNVARAVEELSGRFREEPKLYSEYQTFIQGLLAPKYFYRLIQKPDGTEEIESPYQNVIDFYKRAKSHNLTEGYISGVLNASESFWKETGRRNPAEWTERDLNDYLLKTNQGSKFSVAVALARVAPKIKDVEGRTKGLKGAPRIPPVLRLKNFPDVWRKIRAATVDAALPSEQDEMDLIMHIKITTGMRTGKASAERELWGTKIGTGKSFIITEGEEVAWHVYAKWHEEWNINYWAKGLKERLAAFIHDRNKKVGDYLIDMPSRRANELLRLGCQAVGVQPLHLHDLRKAYVSNLVRAGVPLERAIKINVGWKDIATAYKHYLIFQDMFEGIEDKLRRFDTFV